ncbi:MAG: GNAT family N-acetyltransferase [Gemmatimonadota bacterium]
MSTQPTLTTDRLVLRPFTATDAAAVRQLAGERDVAYNTALIPHPYPEGAAEAWIATHAGAYAAGREVVFAITLLQTGELVGAVGLTLVPEHQRGEMGYWIGKPFWGGGYATEAARRVVRFGFQELGLHRVQAHCFARNAASRRVLEKCGMRYEGRRRGYFQKWGEFLDVDQFGLLATDDA